MWVTDVTFLISSVAPGKTQHSLSLLFLERSTVIHADFVSFFVFGWVLMIKTNNAFIINTFREIAKMTILALRNLATYFLFNFDEG